MKIIIHNIHLQYKLYKTKRITNLLTKNCVKHFHKLVFY